MTVKPRVQSIEGEMAEFLSRIRRLEALQGGSGSGSISCNDIEPEHHRALPLDQSNFVGYLGWPFNGRLNDYVVDANCIENGYIHATSALQHDTTAWTVWLGPRGARFRFEMLTLMDAGSARMHLYVERLVESATLGIWEPQNTGVAPIDIFGGHFADLYTGGGTQYNVWNVSYDFGVAGAGCDTDFDSVDDTVPWGYELNGSPGFYRLWLTAASKNGSSSGYQCRLQSAWLKRLTEDAQ